MSTTIKFGLDSREALKRGVDTVADAVKVTLGASGRNVIIPANKDGQLVYTVTKDGVSVARTVTPKDPFENIGASMIKEAASRANSQAGDGTTTATVIAQDLFNVGFKVLKEDSNMSVTEYKKGLDKAVEDLVKTLRNNSTKVSKKNLKSVATISANGDKVIGEIVSKAFSKIGENGTVISSVSDTAESYVEMRNGVVLDRGYYHPRFVTNNLTDVCELEDTFVLLHKGKLEKGDVTANFLKQVFSSVKNKLLIITDDIDPVTLGNLVENSNGPLKGRICVVKSPQILKIERDLLGDIATLTGAKVVSEVEGVKLSTGVLGKLKRAVMSDRDTLLVGDSDNLSDLIEEIKKKIKITENTFDKKDLQERLSRITGGVATIYVGAKSDSELKEKQDRVEDSINATRSALEEGIVSGGGVALANASAEVLGAYKSEDLEDAFSLGYLSVLESAIAPIEAILNNAGIEYKPHIAKGIGVDVRSGDLVDMIEAGIIDPVKVTRCALENAASVVGTFLTTEAVVVFNQ
ncbi:chaperonin GroEL [Cellulophaga phage phi40:1]|uniref:Chaperonin GroEL n=1 Tax=Cellulophaga phage phi38:1 TaxID=1327977 RepID=R9ZZV2_9CAUD|nr:chaperonin groEL [Cellulophaga phage phi38:1]AGO47870.1 chaperonin GroEL [Cellulophaga phage phi40:1]AGO48035.1 chaperonin GroEL [Cellulophaga phage phi38:1]